MEASICLDVVKEYNLGDMDIENGWYPNRSGSCADELVGI